MDHFRNPLDLRGAGWTLSSGPIRIVAGSLAQKLVGDISQNPVASRSA